MDYSIIFVCLMGMGTVFFGLICMTVLPPLLGRVCGQKQQSAPAAVSPAPAAVSAGDQQELIAAVSAAIAEELGTDITGIRILSIKKV